MTTPFDELKLTGHLPSPTGVGMAILRLTQNDDFTAEDLARTIQSDPALTGRVVKMANSAATAGVTQITGVSEAVVRLGVRAVRNVALGFSLVSTYRSGRCKAFDFDRYWSASLARAIAAQQVSRIARLLVPAEAYICALLSGIGRLALATVHPGPYSQLLARCSHLGEAELALAEREVFGIDHLEVAEAMLLDWKLPEIHGLAIRSFLEPMEPMEPMEEESDLGSAGNALRTALRAAAPIADLLLSDEAEQLRLAGGLEPVRKLAGVDRPHFQELFDAIVSEWRDWGRVLSVKTMKVQPLAELLVRAETATRAQSAKEPAAMFDDIDATADDAGGESELGPLTVMAVEDDPVSLRLLRTHLEQNQFKVITAANGADALALALDQNPHIVVTDWMMPEMDGVALIRNLRRTEIGQDMYILLLTGREREEQVVEAFDAGADDFVAKPFSPKILLSRVLAGERLVRLQDKVARDRKCMERQVAQMAVLGRKLRHTSVTDALTDLPNRRHALETLKKEFERRDPNRNGTVSVVMIDIDHFKQVNDQFGHDVGDAVLRQVSKLFKGLLRRGDTVCRLGGEEFVVLCPGSDLQGAAIVAERLRLAVEQHEFQQAGFDRRITCSFGVAERSPKMTEYEELLKAADVAIYRSKRAGRNRVTLSRETVPTA